MIREWVIYILNLIRGMFVIRVARADATYTGLEFTREYWVIPPPVGADQLFIDDAMWETDLLIQKLSKKNI